MRRRKEKSTDKFYVSKKGKTPEKVSCIKKREKLLTICHESNSNFNKNMLNIYIYIYIYIYIHNQEIRKKIRNIIIYG